MLPWPIRAGGPCRTATGAVVPARRRFAEGSCAVAIAGAAALARSEWVQSGMVHGTDRALADPALQGGERGGPPVMTPLHSHCLDLDLHRLDLRFASSRLMEPHAVERLAQSIERCGQIVPCIVVTAPGDSAEAVVLVDGYRRIAALRRLSRDTAGVEQWSCDLAQAMVSVLARAQDRPFANIEQALLLRELMAQQGLSQHELARRCGRDVSWISRRLQLLSGLPDAALAAVRGGQLSSWAANRVFVPLARANAEHAERLLAMLATTPLSTRELQCWFEHYQKAPRSAREHVVHRPRLFIDTLVANTAWHAGARLRDGPEGECLGDLRCLEAVIARLRKRVATLRPLPAPLITAAPRLRAAIDALTRALEREDA
jgi:ParB family chromosome partitioning protein